MQSICKKCGTKFSYEWSGHKRRSFCDICIKEKRRIHNNNVGMRMRKMRKEKALQEATEIKIQRAEIIQV